MTNIKYLVKLSDIDKFERQNNNIRVNVFGVEGNQFISRLRITKGNNTPIKLLHFQRVINTQLCN